MSRRVRVFGRGTVSTSDTTGIGFIVCTPSQLACSDQPAGYFTTNLFAGTTIDCVPGALTGINNLTSNSDYQNAELTPAIAGNALSYRVVGAGIRIRYKGTNLNRGGTVYALHEPTHDSLQGYSINTMAQQVEMRKMAVGNEWINVLYRPVNNDDNSFSSSGTTASDQTATNNFNYMGMIIESPIATNSSPFEWEVYAVIEYSGTLVRGIQPSHFDPTGFSAVHAASQTSTHRLPFSGEAQKKEKSFLQEVGNYFISAVSWIGNNLGTIATIAEGVAMLM